MSCKYCKNITVCVICGKGITAAAFEPASGAVLVLREALEKIVAIENQMYGPDWEEIDAARLIARAALASTAGATVMPHVAFVEGDEVVRELRWNANIAAFDYPVGTKLYATPTPVLAALPAGVQGQTPGEAQ